MGRRCPVCGRGMFREKALHDHIKKFHGWYFKEFMETGSGGGGLKKEKKKKKGG